MAVPSELIKEKLDLIEFLRGYLNLQPAGKNWKALCPFHKEKTPSFMVSPERQTWKCFGCNEGGDIFTFLMKYENIEFYEALKILAEKAGVELRKISPGDYRELGVLYDINESAKKFFQEELFRSSEAKKYLSDRGLAKEIIEEFEIGWAPPSFDALSSYLFNLGYEPKDIVRAGLSFKNEKGLQIDRFRGRIMFPVHNHTGRVVGFSGRILPAYDDGRAGKYINSPETPIYSKAKLLYGFFKSKPFIRDRGFVFLVEGQMDMLLSWQIGVKNVVAVSGTALTAEHLKSLKRVTDSILLSFDSDEAGLGAGERALELAKSRDFEVRVFVLNDEIKRRYNLPLECKDIADIINSNASDFSKMIDESKHLMEFYFEKYLGPYLKAESIAGDIYRDVHFKKALRQVLRRIKNIPSPLELNTWLKELSKRVKIEERILAEEMERIGEAEIYISGREEEFSGKDRFRELSRWGKISHYFLTLAFKQNRLDEIEDILEYFPSDYQKAYSLLKEGYKKSEDQKIDWILEDIMFLSHVKEEDFEKLKDSLISEYQKEKRKQLLAVLKEAENKGDENLIAKTLKELNNYL